MGIALAFQKLDHGRSWSEHRNWQKLIQKLYDMVTTAERDAVCSVDLVWAAIFLLSCIEVLSLILPPNPVGGGRRVLTRGAGAVWAADAGYASPVRLCTRGGVDKSFNSSVYWGSYFGCIKFLPRRY